MTAPAFWRVPAQPDLLFGRGTQTHYAAEPRGEYFVGLISRRGFRAERGRRRAVFRPGDIGVWDPSDRHAGHAIDPRSPDAGAWVCQLLVIEDGAFERLVGRRPEFPDPVLRDRRLACAFDRMHRASARPGGTLELDTALLDVLRAIAARSADARVRTPAGSDRAAAAARLAREYLRANVTSNVSLAELASVGGVSPHVMVRSFRHYVGVPPHGYQIGLRLALARRMLERGCGAGEVASSCGFHDQSHLHRHFVRNFGLTPGAYAASTARTYKTAAAGRS